MPTLQKNDNSRIDEHYDDVFNNSKQLSDAEKSSFNDIVNNYDQTADSSNEDAAIERAKQASDVVDEQENGTSGSWMNNVTGRKSQGGGKFSLKKSGGPVGIIISLVLGLAGTTSFFGGPGLLIVNLAEKINEKFNYQLTSMDIRTKSIINAKIKNATTGICSPVSIRCKFATFSDKEIANFKKAGIEIEVDSNTAITGRNKISSMSFEGKPIDPGSFTSQMKNNIRFNAAVKQAFNPKFAGFTDKVFNKVATKLRISKKSPFTDADRASDETRLKRIEEDTKNGRSTGVIDTPDDCDAKCQDTKTKQEELNKAAGDSSSGGDSQTSRAMRELDAGDVSKSAASIAGSAASIIKVTGLIDNACTVYGMFKAVSMGAKVIRAAQMARFAMIFLTTASMIKAGDAQADDVSYLGTMLTQTYKTTVDGKEVLTKGATDSFGYRYTAFGDKGIASDTNAMQALAAAGTTGKLAGTLEAVMGVFGNNRKTADTTCGVNNNPFVQGASFVVGVLMWIVPGGQAVGAAKIALQAVLAAATFAAQMFLPALLADMVAGRLIDKNTVGETAGNFIVSGSGHFHSKLAQGGGNAPLRRKQAAKYGQESEVIAQEYRALDQYTHSPFDASNPSTFLGSIYSRFAPFFATAPSSLLQLSSIPTTIVGSTFSNLIPKASADESDYAECKDPEYADIELATDPFCNPVFGIPVELLSDDPNTINTRLLDQGLIDGTTGEPVGNYVTFVANCIDRDIPIGSTGEDSTSDSGEGCFIADKTSGFTKEEQTVIDMYVHYIDQRINYTMENGYESASTGDPGSTFGPGPLSSDTCPAGTETVAGLNKGWEKDNGEEVAITLCAIPDTTAEINPGWTDEKYQGTASKGIGKIVVNAKAAQSVLEASRAYIRDSGGDKLSASVGYRSVYEQCSFFQSGRNTYSTSQQDYYDKYCKPNESWLRYPTGNWTTNVVVSNHMMGYSIDFKGASMEWMRKCMKDSGTNRCFGFYDDVNQAGNGDLPHFTYKPI